MKKNLSTFLQGKFNILLCQKLGWRFAFYYILILGNLYFLINRKEKKKIKEAVNLVFSERDGPPPKKPLTRNIYYGILCHYYEKIFNVYTPTENLMSFFNRHINPEGIFAIQQALARGRGVLLVTGHFGGIEFIPKYLAIQKFPVSILAKFSSGHLKKISEEQAEKMAINLIKADECPNVINAIINDLKENRIVITQCDEIEHWRPSSNKEITFLGRCICLDKTINTLIKRGDTSVVFAIMHRITNQVYRFIAHPKEEIINSYETTPNTSLGEIILKLLEKYIYQYPEEWYQWEKVQTIPKAKKLVAPPKDPNVFSWVNPGYEGTS